VRVGQGCNIILPRQTARPKRRFAARAVFADGLLGLVAVLLSASFWLPITAILVAALAPVIYSLVFYKQLERQGGL